MTILNQKLPEAYLRKRLERLYSDLVTITADLDNYKLPKGLISGSLDWAGIQIENAIRDVKKSRE